VEDDSDDEYRGPMGSGKVNPNIVREFVPLNGTTIKVDEGRESTGGTIWS